MHPPRRLLILSLLGLGIGIIPTKASAEDVAGAEALFRKGIADMEAGHFDTACPALEESNRLDPRPGTLFTLAECDAGSGKIATAVALYEDYIRVVSTLSFALKLKHHDRAKKAAAQRDALTTEIPTLTLVLPKGAPQGVKVIRDGNELAAPSLGIAMPVDPGEHVVVVSTPGAPPAEQRITLAKGEKKTLELKLQEAKAEVKTPATLPVSATPEAAAPPAKSPSAKDPVAAKAEAPGTAPKDPGKGRRIGGFIVGGVGLAGLAVGGATGLLTFSKKSIIQKNCPGNRCNPEAKAAADSAKMTGLVSTIAFGVGGAGIAAGLVLLLTAPSAPKTGRSGGWVTADVLGAGPDGALVGMKGAF